VVNFSGRRFRVQQRTAEPTKGGQVSKGGFAWNERRRFSATGPAHGGCDPQGPNVKADVRAFRQHFLEMKSCFGGDQFADLEEGLHRLV
jgi:hypothetical protein